MAAGDAHKEHTAADGSGSGPATGPSSRRGDPDPLPPPHIAALLTDAHCHPTDEPKLRPLRDADGRPTGPVLAKIDEVYAALAAHPLKNVCIMSSSVDDQHLVRDIATRALADAQGTGAGTGSASVEAGASATTIVPAFGHHPWFVHRISLRDPPRPKKEHYLDVFADAHDEAQPGSTRPPDSERTEELLSLIEYLPEPVALAEVLRTLRADLEAFPNAMLGEVGLDRSFRLPWPPEARALRRKAAQAAAAGAGADADTEAAAEAARRTPGWRASKLAWTLSSFTTPLAHQLAVLQAQFCVAIDLRRSVSFHSVKAQGATADFFMHMTRVRPRGWGIGFSDIKVDLHSCTISAPGIQQIQKTHDNVYVSFSTTINTRQKALLEQIRACDPRRLLSESDFNSALPFQHPPPPRHRAADGEDKANDDDDENEDGCQHPEEADIDDDTDKDKEGAAGSQTLEFPLARRTWAIVQRMADVLDVRQGLGPESGTQYGKRGKEKKRNKARRASAAAAAAAAGAGSGPTSEAASPVMHDEGEDEGEDDDAAADVEQNGEAQRQVGEGAEPGNERLERAEALARLLASNWTRFLDNRAPGQGSFSAGASRRGSNAGASQISNPPVGLEVSADSETDSDDEWNPAARQAVLRQRQEQ